MKPFSVGRIPRGLFLSLIVLYTGGLKLAAQTGTLPAQGTSASNPCAVNQPAKTFPMLDLGCGRSVNYLGLYTGSGDFKPVTRFSRRPNGAGVPEFVVGVTTLRPREVPPFVNLHPREYTVENFIPPARATRAARGQSLFATLRDDIVTFAYGREKILLAPHHLTTDTRGRLIISDPAASVIHVLDGKQSFRIAGGQGRRLRYPSGIATDAEDNIYVADSERAVIEVYDREGRFLREMGSITGGESIFEYPTGIAIDRTNDRLYVLDSPRNLLLVLDLQGTVLNRVGTVTANASGLKVRMHERAEQTERSEMGILGEFRRPTEISIRNGEVAVLDSEGSRVQIIDLQCNFLRQFRTHRAPGGGHTRNMGLAIDGEGSIYVSNLSGGPVTLYNGDGRILNSIGRTGNRVGEFNSPEALWIDSTDTLFVADTSNHRIQVFQIAPPQLH